MDSTSRAEQEPDMELVRSKNEEFNKAIKLSKNYIEEIKKLLEEGLDEKLKDEFEKIIHFVSAQGHNDVFAKDEDGEEDILLEIIDKKGERKQQVFSVDFYWFKIALKFIWFDYCP